MTGAAWARYAAASTVRLVDDGFGRVRLRDGTSSALIRSAESASFKRTGGVPRRTDAHGIAFDRRWIDGRTKRDSKTGGRPNAFFEVPFAPAKRTGRASSSLSKGRRGRRRRNGRRGILRHPAE